MSERKFNVGDRVRIHLPASVNHGTETSIVGVHVNSCSLEPGGRIVRCPIAYEVAIPSDDAPWAYEPHELILLYDGNEKVSWSDCAWKPKGVNA